LAAMLAVTALAISPASAATVTAKSADSFVESIGVNVHLGYAGTPYTEHFATTEQRLEELGVRHVRDELYPNATAQYQAIHELATHGIKSTLILGDPTEPPAALGEMLGTLKTTLAGSVDAVEGPNEYSTRGGTGWEAKLRAYQERLWNGIKGDPALASIPVLGPSIVHNDQQKLGDVSAFLDYGNIHSYPEGGPPEEKVDQFIEKAQKYNSKAKPIFATETGYTNATNWTPTGPGENKPVSEEAAGIYMPRLFFEYWNDEIVRTFSYELVDEHADPDLKEREDNFGLLSNELTPKPAFTSLQNTIRLLSDPGPQFTPGSLAYSLEDGGAKPLHSTLLEKRDGSFYLALWRLQSVWNLETKKEESPAAEPVTVAFPAGLTASYAVYEPSVSAVQRSSGGPTQALTLSVGPGVTIVKLVPAAPVPPTETVPTETPGGPAPVSTAGTQTVVLAPPFMPPVTVPAAEAAPRCLVPKLKGRRLAAARRALRRAGCELGTVARPTAEAAPGTPARPPMVVAQRPRAGAGLAAGSRVAVTLGFP
jgi:hypothetical protein